MERQSSFGSESSAGSAFTSRSATTKAVTDAEKEQGLDNGGQNLLTALFGALYTLAKEKINDSANIAMLAIWIDFLFIFTLLLMPEYPWKVEAESWIYKVFYYIQIHLPIADTGYTFYLVIFYILVAILFLSVAICIWVGWCFMNDNFPFLWPIKVARVVVSVFVSMFYIASLNVFLMACACKNDHGVWTHLVFGLDCLAFPHLIHAVFSLTSAVIFAVVAFLLVLGDHELEPMSKSLLAAPHSMSELRALLCKTIISTADILLKPVPKLQVVLYCITCGLIFYYHARMVPHYVPWINVLRGGLNAVLAWVSLMACILSYTVEWHEKDHHHYWYDEEYRHTMTVVMSVGVPLSFIIGGAICWARLVYAWRAALKFKELPADVKPRTIHRFSSEFDVEVASRIGRVWDAEGVLDPTALDLAENVLKAGVIMKPNSVFLHIAYSNFLIDVRHNNQLGWSHLERARKLEPNLSYQFSIFTRNQEHKQKAAGGGGGDEGSVDLVSYVEFQKNYRALLVYHKASLVAIRDFWRMLTRDTILLEKLGHSFKRMDEMEFMAEKTYKLVLDRYPKNAKLLKSYGKFLEHVKNDPWGAARYYAEAEKQEEMADTQATELKIGAGDVFGVVDEKSAIITINAQSIIQTANKAACQTFGYKKGELEGKNVSILIPAPFSYRHATYVRNYLTTGKAKILDMQREVVVMHKNRYVMPLQITVSKVGNSGQESMFMALLQPPAEPDPDTIKAWMLTSGTVLCVDQSFSDYAGWAPNELVGRAFSSLGADSSELDDLIANCAQFNEAQLKAGVVQKTTSIKHKYSEDVPVHIKIELGGTDDQRFLIVVMKKLQETTPMAAFNNKGACVYANTPLASLLGYKLSALRTKDIGQLMPQPYSTLHMSWIKEAESMVAKNTPNSCRLGTTSVMLSSNGTPTYVKVVVAPHYPKPAANGSSGIAAGGEVSWTVKASRSSSAQLLNERRLMLLVTSDGTIKWANPGTPAQLFGLDPAALVGTRVTSIVDVFAEHEANLVSGDLAAALAALLSRSTSRPWSSWRVGVGSTAAAAVASSQQSTAQSQLGGTGTEIKRMMVRQVSARSRLKPALMTVNMPSEEVIPEDVLGQVGTDGAVVLELWRADMLLGVAEVVDNCSLVRVEHSVGMLFGVPYTAMLNTSLNQWLNLPATTQLDDLMGNAGAKKGGMKLSSRTSRLGPRLATTCMHADQRPVQITLQACMKDGAHDGRLVLAIKVLKPLIGAPNLLANVIAAETEGFTSWAGGAADGVKGAGELVNLSGVGGQSGKVDLMGAGSHNPTYRSVVDSNMATVRMVDIDMKETPGARPPEKQHRAPAMLARASHDETDDQSDLAVQARTPAARDIAVSSGSEDDEDHSQHGNKGARKASTRHSSKKLPLTEEEREAMMEAKGAKKAKEWLESGFGGFKQDEEEGDVSLPGAVEGGDAPIRLMQARRSGEGEDGDEISDAAAGDAQAKAAAGDGSASEGMSSFAGDAGGVGDYSRGKRLRKLTRLLDSKAALQVVTSFKFKLVLMAIVIVMLHIAFFGAVMGLVQRSAVYLKDVSAAGEVMDVMHRSCTLSLVLDAAQRGYGFTAADTEKYAAELEKSVNRFEQLHQGLYLGFNGLRSLDTPELYKLWHESNLQVTVFRDAVDHSLAANESISLFNLGALFTTAARDVQYAAVHPTSAQADSGPLSDNRQWYFLQVNGPGVMYDAYKKGLDYMVVRAQDDVKMMQGAELILLVVEGCAIMFLAVAYFVRLLSSISVHRQALFSVFLAIPHGYLRTLASKSVSIGVDDDGDEDEEDKALQKAEARKQKHKHAEGTAATDKAEAANQEATTGQKPRKTNFLLHASGGGDGTVVVHASGAGKKTANNSIPGATDRDKLFNGKQLTTSTASSYKLAWPFALWGIMVIVLYGISYRQSKLLSDHLVQIKLLQRTLAQTSRATYFTTRVALEPDASKRAAMQPKLLEESRTLDTIYFTALYGGPTLPDSVADGSHDESRGSLFSAPSHKEYLFGIDGCLRYNQASCLPEYSPYYAVSRHGIDPMVQRLSREAELMSYELAADIQPTGSRFGFVWSVTWEDLHDGLSFLVSEYISEIGDAFNVQRIIHIVLLLATAVAGLAFLVLMMRPFLRHISKESRRCAELLAQLPTDLDVEGMVAATWSVVKQERILAERSGKTFIGAMYGGEGGLTGLISRISSVMSLRGPSHTTQPSFVGQAGGDPFGRPMGRNSRFNSGMGDGDRLFSPREQSYAGQGRGRFVQNAGSVESTPRYSSGPGVQWKQGRSENGMLSASGNAYESGGGSGPGDLRRRNVGAGLSRSGRSPSKRAIVPYDDDDEQ